LYHGRVVEEFKPGGRVKGGSDAWVRFKIVVLAELVSREYLVYGFAAGATEWLAVHLDVGVAGRSSTVKTERLGFFHGRRFHEPSLIL
jgi:hypothetical protein